MKDLKDQAMKTASQLLSAGPAAGLLAHPALQDMMRRVLALPTEVRDALDEQVAAVAKRFDLVTKKELKRHKRMVRELENQVATLEHELAQQRRKTERAEGELETARKELATLRKASEEAAGEGRAPRRAKAAREEMEAEAGAGEQAALALEAPAEPAKKGGKAKGAGRKRKKAEEAEGAEATEGDEASDNAAAEGIEPPTEDSAAEG